MSSSPQEIIQRASEGIEAEGGFTAFVKNRGIGGIVLAVVTVTISAILSAGGVIMKPLRAFGDGLAQLVGGTIGGGVTMIEASLRAGVRSFESGLPGMLGPFAFPLAVVAVMLGVGIFMYTIQRIGFSPLSLVRDLRG